MSRQELEDTIIELKKEVAIQVLARRGLCLSEDELEQIGPRTDLRVLKPIPQLRPAVQTIPKAPKRHSFFGRIIRRIWSFIRRT